MQQSIQKFREVLNDFNFGDLFVDGNKPNQIEHLFMSIQSIDGTLHLRMWVSFFVVHSRITHQIISEVLYPQLVDEMKRLEIDPQRFVYFYNFKEFIDKVIKSALERSDKREQIAAELFIENKVSSSDISKRTCEFISSVNLGYYDVLFPGEYSKLTFLNRHAI